MVEFALIAIPFFALLGAIIELGILFTAEESLELAFQQTTRGLRTGSIKTQKDFIDGVCNLVTGLVNCKNIRVQSTVYTQGTIPNRVNIPNSGTMPSMSSFSFDTGSGGNIIIVELFYIHKLFFNKLGLGIGNLGGGKQLIIFTRALRNEPY